MFSFLALFFLLFAAPVFAQESPLFLADLANPNDFSLFASGGWDGSWYVGFNKCWMQKLVLPANSDGKYKRAFIGARLGRMKSYLPEGKAPWEKKAKEGSLYIGISPQASWSRNQSFFLTSTDDIPLEPDMENAVEGVGESRWFWREVPLKSVNFGGENFLALWSPTESLNAVDNSPILAAGWGTKDVDSWVSDIKGFPPTDAAKALSTAVTVFEPAIAIKLIPGPSTGTAQGNVLEKPKVAITRIEDGKPRGKMPAPKIVWSEVNGQSIERAWIEFSTDSKTWNRAGRYGWNAPYAFTLKMEEIPIDPAGKTWVRVSAADALENVGTSSAVNLLEPLK